MNKKINFKFALYTFLWSLFFLILGSRVIDWGENLISIRGFSQWMDYPVHLAFSRFMEGVPLWEMFKSHPYFPWSPFNYYFIPDLIVTFLLKWHVRFDWALLLPTVGAFALFIHQKAYFLRHKNFSLKAIFLSDLLFLFLGGCGFVFFALYPDLFGVSNNLELSSFYIDINKTLYSSYYSNPLAGHFFSAKNTLWGLAIFFVCLNLLERKRYVLLLASSLIFPFIHAHSFVLFMLWWFLSFFFVRENFKLKDYFIFLATAFLCFILLKMTLLRFSGTGFLQLRFGWRSSPFDFETYKVMFLGTGLFWPWALFLFFKTWKNIFFKRLFFYSLVVLGLTHFIQWQPNIWDNIKIYTLAHLFAAMGIAGAMVSLWSESRIYKKILLGLLSFTFILNGLLENYFIFFTNRHLYPLVTQRDVKISEEFKAKYQDGKVYYENLHHHWYPILVGKNIAMGFKYNLWTWGVPYQSYLENLSPLLQNPQEPSEFKKLNIHYVIASKLPLFPHEGEAYERTLYPEKARHVMPFFYVGTGDVPPVNIPLFRNKFPVFVENQDWVIFDVSRSL